MTLFIIVKYLHKLPLIKFTTTRPKIDWNRFWFVFIIWGIVSLVLTLVGYYLMPEDFVVQFNLVPFLILSLIVLIMIPLQTSFEEYLFRGYLMQGFGVLFKNKWAPLVITSVAFGLLHLFNPEIEKMGYFVMVYYIGTGFFLGIITLMDEGLELALGFHAANNMFIALLVTSDWSALQTHAILKDVTDPSEGVLTQVLTQVFVFYPILLFILAKKYKWTNWKDKLFGKVAPPVEDNYKIIE